jgi:hypothetical protein
LSQTKQKIDRPGRNFKIDFILPVEKESGMQLREIITEQDKKAFLEMPLRIYKEDPNWIRPLDQDIEGVFDPAKNKFFRHGTCKRWLLLDSQGHAIGRIAVFVNERYKQQQPTGGVGFFECINDQAAADHLFDHCRAWLQQQGMEAMDGPINFGERDRWWGLLTEGFFEPLYCMNYNPPYYKTLLEHYGFKVYFNQVCFGMKTQDSLQEKFSLRHAEFAADPAFQVRRINKKSMDLFAKDFTEVYNKAWAAHGENKQLEERTALKMFAPMKTVIDPDLVWFAYHKEQPVAMWVNLPDLNQFFKHLHGKFGWWQKLRFLWLKIFGKCNRFVGLVFGIVPEFQGKGIDAFLIVEGARVIRKKNRYEDFEMQWIGDFNPKMLNVAEGLGAHPTRKLATYRYLFDRSKPFQRHPML